MAEPSDQEPSDQEPSDQEPSDQEPSDQEPSDVEPSTPEAASASTPSAQERKTPDERKQLLARTLQTEVAQGARIESQSDYQAVTVKGHRINNTLHLILTIVTFGLWGIVWIVLAFTGGEKRSMVTVDDYGNVMVQKL